MKRFLRWFRESNRDKHFLGGVVIGAGADSVYCAAYAGAGVASVLELKDKMWGGKWDWLDWGFTVAGVAVGYSLRLLTKSILGI